MPRRRPGLQGAIDEALAMHLRTEASLASNPITPPPAGGIPPAKAPARRKA